MPERPFSPGLIAAPVFAGAAVLLALLANGATLSTGDTQALRWLPSRILLHRTLDLTGHPQFLDDPPHYSVVRIGERLLPMAPPGTALLALPHAAAALAASGSGVTPALVERWEKQAAALLVAAAAALFLVAVRRVAAPLPSLAATAVLALATPAFTTAGQALFPATGAVFALCLALALLLSDEGSRGRTAAAGLAIGLAFLCRPTAALAAVPLTALLSARRKGEAAPFALAGAASVALGSAWLAGLYGHPLGGWGIVNLREGMWGDPAAGLAGVLLSPSRGLLWHFPYLVLLPAAWRSTRGDLPLRRLWLAALAALAATLLLTASYGKWWGGHGIGPRLLAEAAPWMALLVLPLLGGAARPAPRLAAIALCAASAVTQLLGAFRPAVLDWNTVVDVDRNPDVLWSLGDSQLAATWLPSWKPCVPFAPPGGASPLALRASVDEPREGAVVRRPLVVFGWARTEGDDLGVTFLLDGATRSPDAFERLPRPDVAAAFPALGASPSCGFRARFDPRPGDAGARRLQLRLRARDGRERVHEGPRFVWSP